ncbi:MAG: heme exporter protein CcmD [Gammaproteobacteria bacterium]|nr:heme exporter protein CcmD [Gammaproteobacteria bacterium]NND38348.1 heme exporter protein CcmD [Pseudomonadales bacterium]MBT8150570.1 heme exporter protein CcmD [Gammaproteobacteria bacterium]NNL11536.1 heme exporter protein CcmD [Pseudomonadales bacterium]NNM12338.1 heme exporter protein CcmD [Pseudomonadales bacterium]
MYFDSLTALLNMDGHGAYVWGAYAISMFVIAVCIVQPLLRYRAELKRLAASRQPAHQLHPGDPDGLRERN